MNPATQRAMFVCRVIRHADGADLIEPDESQGWLRFAVERLRGGD
jgi:hypothetical protein